MATTFSHGAPRRHARTIRLVLGGLLLYAVFLLAQAPAGLLAWALTHASGGALVLERPLGTLWNGSGTRLLWVDGEQQVELGRVNWAWRPLELARARLGHYLSVDDGALRLRASVALGLGGIELERLSAGLQAQAAGQIIRPLGLVHPQGELELDARALRLGRAGQIGEATLSWRNARSGMISEPLGDYRLRLTPAPGGASAIHLDTLQGPLRAQGEGRWQPPDRLTLRATLQPPADRLQSYAPALNLLAKAGRDGVYTLELTAP